MTSQPFTGINQQPLVFAQIRNGSSAAEENPAKVCVAPEKFVLHVKHFLQLFYQGSGSDYCHEFDKERKFQVINYEKFKDHILVAAKKQSMQKYDVSIMPVYTVKDVITLSGNIWNFKPSVRVADFFANSLGVPIDCWTACSRMEISRELENADILKYELTSCDEDKEVCAMTAGELHEALNGFHSHSDKGKEVQLSILFENENPEIQSLDLRLTFVLVSDLIVDPEPPVEPEPDPHHNPDKAINSNFSLDKAWNNNDFEEVEKTEAGDITTYTLMPIKNKRFFNLKLSAEEKLSFAYGAKLSFRARANKLLSFYGNVTGVDGWPRSASSAVRMEDPFVAAGSQIDVAIPESENFEEFEMFWYPDGYLDPAQYTLDFHLGYDQGDTSAPGDDIIFEVEGGFTVTPCEPRLPDPFPLIPTVFDNKTEIKENSSGTYTIKTPVSWLSSDGRGERILPLDWAGGAIDVSGTGWAGPGWPRTKIQFSAHIKSSLPGGVNFWMKLDGRAGDVRVVGMTMGAGAMAGRDQVETTEGKKNIQLDLMWETAKFGENAVVPFYELVPVNLKKRKVFFSTGELQIEHFPAPEDYTGELEIEIGEFKFIYEPEEVVPPTPDPPTPEPRLLKNEKIPKKASLNAVGPAWTTGDMEPPAGEKDMGGWTAAVYTEEQQQKLKIDEFGKPTGIDHNTFVVMNNGKLDYVKSEFPIKAVGKTRDFPPSTIIVSYGNCSVDYMLSKPLENNQAGYHYNNNVYIPVKESIHLLRYSKSGMLTMDFRPGRVTITGGGDSGQPYKLTFENKDN